MGGIARRGRGTRAFHRFSEGRAKWTYLGDLLLHQDTLIALGGHQHETIMLASSDGRHVHEIGSPETSGLRAGLSDGERIWVVGEYGMFAYSEDWGESWEEMEEGGSSCLFAITRSASGTLLVGGSDGGLWESEDEGESWDEHEGRIAETIGAIVPIGDSDFFLLSDGRLMRRTGDSWCYIDTGATARLCALAECPSGALVLVGDEAFCARSEDGGGSWRRVKHDSTASFEALAMVGSELVLVGSQGTVRVSRDEGKSWAQVDSGCVDHLWSILPVEDGAFIGGERGVLMRWESSKAPIWAGREDSFAKRAGADDELFDCSPQEFFEKGLARFVGQQEPAERDKDAELEPIQMLAGSDTDDVQPVWGTPASAELELLTRVMKRRKRDPYEWRFCDAELSNVPEEHNLFELLVLRDQRNYLGTGLFEAFAGLHFLGYQGNGDYYFYELFPPKDEEGEPKKGQVLHFDHEEFGFDEFAAGLPELAYFTCLCEARSERKLSDRVWDAAIARISDKISPSWHFGSVLDDAGLEYDGDQASHARAYRCRWLIYLFRQDGVMRMNDIPALFDERFNPALTDELWDTVKGRFESTPMVLMLLWRSFFFDDELWLERMRPVAREHASRLVRDALALIEAFERGRKELGKIEDIHELKRQFIALDLDPARAEEREKERLEAEAQQKAKEEDAIEELRQLRESGADLAEIAWERMTDRAFHHALRGLAPELPELESVMPRLRWLRENGYHRHNRILDHEKWEVVEVLMQGLDDGAKALLVPMWVASVIHELTDLVPADEYDEDDTPKTRVAWYLDMELLRELARSSHIDPRAATHLRPLLEVPGDYEHKRQRVLWALAAMKDAETVNWVCRYLDSVTPEQGPYYLDFGDAEQLAYASLRALGEIGDARGKETLKRCLSEWGAGQGRALRWAARSARVIGDESFVDVCLDLAAKLHDTNNFDEGVAWALWAASELGAEASASKKAAWIDKLPPVSRYRQNINLGRALCIESFSGKAPDFIDEWVLQRLGDESSSSSYDHVRTEMALEAFPHSSHEVDLIEPFVYRDDPVFRRLARQALEARGVQLGEEKRVDLFSMDELFDAGDEAVRQALEDETLIFRSRIAEEIANRGLTSLSAAVVAYVRELLTHLPRTHRDLPTDLEYRLYWAVDALRRLGLDEESKALFLDLLLFPNRDVKDPVLRNPPLDPALEPGMRQVLEEKWGWQESTAREWFEEMKKAS